MTAPVELVPWFLAAADGSVSRWRRPSIRSRRCRCWLSPRGAMVLLRIRLDIDMEGARVARLVENQAPARRGVAARYCPGCGTPIPDRLRGDAIYCSAACRARHWRWLQRSRARVRAIRGTAGARARCPECGSTWVVGLDRRANAVYCSHRCRTRGWRHSRSQYPSQ
jgi:endogenous inhibitor of DNA gyrase (YacG/DUF329 family)